MFTGLVEELGTVERVEPRAGRARRLVIRADAVLVGTHSGASIAVNGCCLSVVDLGPGWWAADVVPETIERTTLGELAPGDPVNLERSLAIGDRLGGHLVQGHIDTTVEVLAHDELVDGSGRLAVTLPRDLEPMVVEKGSIALDGVSLTVAAVGPDVAEVALIPHTRAVTTLGHRWPGDRLNLEVDVLAKHVARLVAAHLDGRLVRAPDDMGAPGVLEQLGTGSPRGGAGR